MTASAGPVLKRLYASYGNRVAFVTLYVREAHPGGRYPQPQTFEEKLEHASAYTARDEIPWIVAVDDIEGSLHRTLDAKPESAYLMDTTGNVAFRVLWANNEAALRTALEKLIRGYPTPLGESEAKLGAMLEGMGVMYDVLGFAGQQAREDVKHEVPPMYGMIRLAALFRPLPPLQRTLAAMSVTVLGMVVVGLGVPRALSSR